MARWKGLGVAAVAALAFVAVKVVPWALGFAGGKYLYQTVMGSHDDSAKLTVAQVSDQLQSQGFQIFKVVKQEFPNEYDAIVQKIAAVAASGGDEAEVRNVSRVAVADLRHKYASLLRSTPDDTASEALGAQLDMLKDVMARESAATCNSYLRNGPDALGTPDKDFLNDMDKIGATLFHAFGAAKNGGLPAADPSDQDWSLLADAFTSAGGTPAEMDAIANISREFEGLCPAAAKLYAAALSLQGESGRRIKTALLYEIAKN
ncbi:MAG: hypothetical protein EOS36_17320 [Mesorhizobium sp.]|uniref:hypothetical protein n=1 Tax=Mesorhizobium sp. TaxID=1871066 RepID=UPI000FE97007|nr:hypothetical protein [Mesorhizobium sp.]RWD61639.1 MAG: hypothetical protein EOS36_17320 [Mesorhizobium sp.]RWE47765.1 MAG: hypothetical protein EOS79_09795 [Mesorhizobium sp.]